MKRFLSRLRPQARKSTEPRGHPEIDVRQRARELTDQELVQGADAYFAKFTPDSIQYKKPFSDPEQAVYLTQHLGLLFQAADLFRGARVLDFGCATGWLSLGMAQMGCDVVGVDIAASALKLADRLKATRRVPSDGRLEFRLYDGQRLPMADDTFDRIVCCDSFHHVRDQAHVLREFARVLKDGGRIAFVEPGPRHSTTEQSQDEMRRHKVIENDISMGEIAAHARAAGLGAPEMLVQFQRPLQLTLEEFQQWAEKGIPGSRARELLKKLARQVTDTQYFFIPKGQPRLDSRKSASLGGELTLLDLKTDATTGNAQCAARFTIRNTGQGDWLTQKDAHGQVRLGAHLYAADGGLVNLDFARFDLEGGPIGPGQERTIEVRFKLPALPAYRLRFDLVAEHVTWFGQVGRSKPVEVPSDRLRSVAS
jgi:ubiquinone/menaquinone biosynthesis C-methylase UbiE